MNIKLISYLFNSSWSVPKELDKKKGEKNSKIKEGQNVKENVHKGI
jgi:hypothetical protein